MKYVLGSMLALSLFFSNVLFATAVNPTCTLSVTPSNVPLFSQGNLTISWTTTNASNISITETTGPIPASVQQNFTFNTVVQNGSMTVPFVGTLRSDFTLTTGSAVCHATTHGAIQ